MLRVGCTARHSCVGWFRKDVAKADQADARPFDLLPDGGGFEPPKVETLPPCKGGVLNHSTNRPNKCPVGWPLQDALRGIFPNISALLSQSTLNRENFRLWRKISIAFIV